MDKICLDTDFLIDFLRGKEYAISFVSKVEDGAVLATTYVNLYELYVGAYKSENPPREIANFAALKNRLLLLNLSEESVQLAGKIRAGLVKTGDIIEIRDLLIGAIAAVNGFSVKTNNMKHFSRIPGIKLA